MKRNHAIKKTFIQSIRRMFLFFVAISLLSAQLSQAAAICLCNPQSECQTETCDCCAPPEKIRPVSVGDTQQSGEPDPESLTSSESYITNVAAVADGYCNNSMLGAVPCRFAQSQADMGIASFSAQKPISIQQTQQIIDPSTLSSCAQVAVPIPYHSRPLYLSLSSLLI